MALSIEKLYIYSKAKKEKKKKRIVELNSLGDSPVKKKKKKKRADGIRYLFL